MQLFTLFTLLTATTAADTGLSCTDWVNDEGKLVDDVCVVESIDDCCPLFGCATWSSMLARYAAYEATLVDCAPGSEVGHVYKDVSTEFYSLHWYGHDGELLGYRTLGDVCCEGVWAESFRCGEPLGTCYAGSTPSESRKGVLEVCVEPEPEEPRAPEEPGCTTTPATGTLAGMVVLVVTLWHRRRGVEWGRQ